MTRAILLALPLIAAAALAGCATGDMADYPSLAQRPIERQANVPPTPEIMVVPGRITATLFEALRALAADADRGEMAFQAALGEARSASVAGRGAAVGSEAWAQAQLALSRAEAARAPTTFALAELDRLMVVQGDEGNDLGLPSIMVEQERVAVLVAGQERALAELGAD